MNKAIFYDRDGIVLHMVYDLEHGVIDTARTGRQVSLVPGIIELLKHTSSLGYLNIIISNQPGIGLKKISEKNFKKINKKMLSLIDHDSAKIDVVYYCLHHPFAKISKYRKDCNCRKPKTGLLNLASKEYDIDLKKSYVIGDGVSDILLGAIIKSKTILLANLYESEYLRILEEKLGKIKPDFLIKRLKEAIDIIKD